MLRVCSPHQAVNIRKDLHRPQLRSCGGQQVLLHDLGTHQQGQLRSSAVVLDPAGDARMRRKGDFDSARRGVDSGRLQDALRPAGSEGGCASGRELETAAAELQLSRCVHLYVHFLTLQDRSRSKWPLECLFSKGQSTGRVLYCSFPLFVASIRQLFRLQYVGGNFISLPSCIAYWLEVGRYQPL